MSIIIRHRIYEIAYLAMVYWQMKELRWYGVEMTKEARAILAGIKASKIHRVAA